MNKDRRKFFQNTGIIAATTAFSPNIIVSASRIKKEKLGVALVGLGYYSTNLLAPALKLTKNCELKGIVTGSPDKIPKRQEQYQIKEKNIYTYQNFDRIANNSDIDVIYVVLPPSMHAEYTIRAAKAGKHVWCEKPMASSVIECQSMIKACADNKVKLAIGYRCQHDPNIQSYINVGKQKPFGKVRMISSAAGYFDGRRDHWKQKKNMGGGAMGDMGVYALQGARLATGEEPISVMAQSSTTRPKVYHEVDETMMFQLEFPSGALAACQTSFGIQMNYLNINYEKGWLKMEPHSSYSGNKGTMSNGTIINFPLENQQAKQMDEDADSIINNKDLIVPGEEGLKDINIVEAIYKSAEQNCKVRL